MRGKYALVHANDFLRAGRHNDSKPYVWENPGLDCQSFIGQAFLGFVERNSTKTGARDLGSSCSIFEKFPRKAESNFADNVANLEVPHLKRYVVRSDNPTNQMKSYLDEGISRIRA